MIKTKKIIQRFKLKHGILYDYGEVKYINMKTKVKILCCIHGLFEQNPDNHLQGQGCPHCANMTKQSNLINDFIITHKNRYDYSFVDYYNSKTKIKIKCKKHGFFYQRPDHHKQGQGCPDCKSNHKRDNIEIIKDFKNIHGTTYDYSKVEYTGAHNLVKIKCNKCNKYFEQSASSHKCGRGCPDCGNNKTAFDKYYNRPTTLYYIKIDNLYKIGLTQQTVEKRFRLETNKIVILKTWYFKNGWNAYKKEQNIINDYNSFQYIGENILKCGNTELFFKDVLNLDI